MGLAGAFGGVGDIQSAEPPGCTARQRGQSVRSHEPHRHCDRRCHIPSLAEDVGQDTRMKILVDGRPLLPIGPGLGPTGVGRWTAGVLRGLSRAAPTWEILVTVVTREEVTIEGERFGPNVEVRRVPRDERWFRRRLVLGLPPNVARAVGGADAMLGPGFVTWPGRYAEIPV